MLAFSWTDFWMWPLYILLFLLILFAVIAVLGRVQNGRYLRPAVSWMTKVPILRGWLTKASEAALRKQNPELASAVKKLQSAAPRMHDPAQAQKAMSKLTAGERRAYMEYATQQQDQLDEPMNREQRRRLEKARRDAQRRGGKR